MRCSADKQAITIEDLPTMQPGLDCADSKLGGAVQDSQDWVWDGRQVVMYGAAYRYFSAPT